MAEFRWGDSSDESEDEKSSPLDVLIAAAGGDPLPGVFGLLQALLNVWTSSPPMPEASRLHWILWGGRSTLNSFGVIRTYRRALDKTWSVRRKDPVDEFVKTLGVQTFKELQGLANMIHVYAETLEREDRILGSEKSACIRCFRLPNGVEFFFLFRQAPDSTHPASSGQGPYLRPVDFDQFLVGMGRLIWESEGNADLQLMPLVGPEKSGLAIMNIGSPEDYVSEGSVAADVEQLHIRCTALMRKGFTRKILFAGPPGCGKSTLARSLARKLGGGNALRIHPEVVDRYPISQIMKFVRLLSPRVILFDDLDRNESDTLNILHYMEQAGDVSWTRGIVVIGTVNTLSTLDPALFRPGRFDEVHIVVEPEIDHRRSILEHYRVKFGVDLSGFDVDQLLVEMDQFSPADIQEVLKVVSAIGTEHLRHEIDRVQLQRGLFAGNRVEEFLLRRRQGREEREERGE